MGPTVRADDHSPPMPARYTFLALALFASSASAQTPGDCTLGSATAELSLAGVRASVYNTGGLFWNGGPVEPFYEVPKGGGVSALFTAGLWTGGVVGGEVRTAWADYADWEFWPGPLDDGATLPDSDDCSAFDRIYRIGAPELLAYEDGGPPTLDLTEWPVGLGAPAVDAQGAPVVPTSRDQTIDLAAGERPVVYGTETLFWVTNDVGNDHLNSDTPPMGIEMRTTAFSVNDPDEDTIDRSTYYRFEVVNRSDATIEDFRLGFWVDFDLGDFQDDYVGSDPERSMFYVYNSDNDDAVGADGYGVAPPALGVDILTGAAHGMTYNSNNNGVNGNPSSGPAVYNFLSGFWLNGQRWTRGGDATNEANEPTDWFFDGDPTADVRYWTELDASSAPGDQPNVPDDRRGVVSALPVDLAPGASHTVDVAIVYARGTDNLDSVSELRAASDLVQARYDDGSLFETTAGDLGPPPATAPALLAPEDGRAFTPPASVVLDWAPTADADRYRVEYASNPAFGDATRQTVTSPPATVDFSELPEGSFEPIYWRVTPLNDSGAGPSSETRSFTYGFTFDAGVLTLSNGQFAFVEVAGPGGADPCGDAAGSTFGCDEAGGNAVYVPFGADTPDANGSGIYALSSLSAGPEQNLLQFAPRDYEIRFTAEGSIAYHLFNDTPGHPTHRVPFEVWDIGVVPLGADGTPAPNDPSDDVQLVPIVFSDNTDTDAEACTFEFGEVVAADSPLGVALSDRIYAYYPVTTYAEFDAALAPLVDAAPDGCLADGSAEVLPRIDIVRGRPVQRVVVADLTGSGRIADLEGAVIRFHTSDPQPVADEAAPTAGALALTVAPNPSRGAARVSFALAEPGIARVRVVDVLGREVAVLADGERAAGRHTVALPRRLASGVYVVTVEASGERAARTLTVVR